MFGGHFRSNELAVKERYVNLGNAVTINGFFKDRVFELHKRSESKIG